MGRWELGWDGAKPWWMQGLPIMTIVLGTWPAGCLFPWQPEALRKLELGNGVGCFQEVGLRHGTKPRRSGNR